MEKNISKNIVLDKLFETLDNQITDFIEHRLQIIVGSVSQLEGFEKPIELIRDHFWDISSDITTKCEFTRDAVKALLKDEGSEDHS